MPLIGVACLLLTVAAGAWVFSAQEEAPAEREREIRIATWRERKKAVYENLKDLHFEHLAGKLSEEDFERTRTMLESEAAATVAALEDAER